MQSYPKVSKSSSERTGKPRKRRFHGNQFHNVSSSEDGEANTSRSENKLASATTDDVIIYPSHCYRIIELVSVFLAISDLKIGQQCNNFVERANKERVTRENRRASFSSKEARTARRLEHLGENQFFEESEGQPYGPGIAD